MLIDPARACKPRDKPRVERPMPYCRDSFFRGREFASIQVMQQAAPDWSLDVAGRRPCRPLHGAAPLSVFAAIERDELKPLPRTVFVLASWSSSTVGPDIHVRVGKGLLLGAMALRAEGRRPDNRHDGADLPSGSRVGCGVLCAGCE